MPRKARNNSISCFYHVMVQGINKEFIFNENKYLQAYKCIVKKGVADSNTTIIAYCIMNNHAHFLIYSEQIDYLSKFMHKINTAFSYYYNREMQRVGPVFRDRFKSQDIMTLKQLYNCFVYIHKNPIKAGIVREFQDYKYSSFNEFIYKKEIINSQSIKLLFGRDKNYIDQFYAIHKAFDEGDFIEPEEKKIKKDILSFIKEVEQKHDRRIRELVMNREYFEKFVKKAKSETDVTIKELAQILGMSKTKVGNYLLK